jgi:hypothetical protein
MLAKKTVKNQITLPQEIVKEFPGIDYFDARVENSKILLTPVTIRPVGASLVGVRDKMKRLGIRDEDVAEAVQWSRRRRKSSG